ncbi:MAG: nucleoside hydrolase [Chloroflexota bacterium]|nr:nucleoside hydrolase [Chloroflexota bacterium]
MIRIHLDTDIAGDTDDLCALAMVLNWPGAELVGVTTTSDQAGYRAACVHAALRLAGRDDIPVAAGADGSLSGYYMHPGIPAPERYWPEVTTPMPSSPGAALDLLAASAEAGAVIVAIGPWTNLALLEIVRPGLLARTRVFAMGGYIEPPDPGLPQWSRDVDYNVQQDTLAARIVWERCDPILVPLNVCLETTLRAEHLPVLRRGNALARLVADQGEIHGTDDAMFELGSAHERLPNDLLNFQYDPLACAVALEWDGVRVEPLKLAARMEGSMLTFPRDPEGRPTCVAVAVDGPRFEEAWLAAVAGPRSWK